jgi:hypothetical protein
VLPPPHLKHGADRAESCQVNDDVTLDRASIMDARWYDRRHFGLTARTWMLILPSIAVVGAAVVALALVLDESMEARGDAVCTEYMSITDGWHSGAITDPEFVVRLQQLDRDSEASDVTVEFDVAIPRVIDAVNRGDNDQATDALDWLAGECDGRASV